MNKYLYFIVCIIGLIFLLAGYDKAVKNLKPTDFKTVNNIEGVTMKIKEGTVSPTGLTVILDNTTDKQCIYGKPFVLERKINGKWYQVPAVIKNNYGFEDIAYILSAKSNAEVKIDWEWLYGNLKPGEYRIIKDISIDSQEYNPYHLSAKFTIK